MLQASAFSYRRAPRAAVASTPTSPATASSRLATRQVLPPMPSEVVGKGSPKSPNSAWLFKRSAPVGIDPSTLPDDLDLKTPRTGRVVKLKHDHEYYLRQLQHETTVLAMFPASSSVKLAPPFPGVPPASLNNPRNADWCYINGTQGPYDPRHQTQLFNERTPWTGFHERPERFDYVPTKCEIQPADAFFRWNVPAKPAQGGYWIDQRLADLYTRRELCEKEFAELVAEAVTAGDAIPFNDRAFRRFHYDLPFYDPSEWADVAKLTTWGQGRDMIAYTLQYVANVKAINCWLRAQIDWHTHPSERSSVPPPNSQLMGVWASTIRSKQDWQFLRYSCVPIFIATLVPQSHSAYKYAVPSNLDADERFRECSLEREHGLKPLWAREKAGSLQALPSLSLECRDEDIPLTLYPVIPPKQLPNEVSTSSLLGWQSAIFQDRSIRRTSGDDLPIELAASSARRKMEELFPYSPPTYNCPEEDIECHPLLDAIAVGFSRDVRVTCFEEVYDQEANAYYPVRLGGKNSQQRANNFTYRFSHNEMQIEICTNFPFPGRPLSYGRQYQHDEDKNNEYDISPETASSRSSVPSENLRPRHYFPGPPGEARHRERGYTWSPLMHSLPVGTTKAYDEQPVNLSTHGQRTVDLDAHSIVERHPNHLIIDDDPVVVLQYRPGNHSSENPNPTPQVFTDYASQLRSLAYIDIDEVETDLWRVQRDLAYVKDPDNPRYAGISVPAPERLMSVEQFQRENEEYRQLFVQRNSLHSEVRRRLFKPRGGDSLVSEIVTPWIITNGTFGEVCYPIRIGNIHGDATIAAVFALLRCTVDIRQHEVALFSRNKEVDTTLSYDIGLRYAEDALLTRIILHGVEIDGRFLEVQYLFAMAGGAQIVDSPLASLQARPRSLECRAERASSILSTTGASTEAIGQAWYLLTELCRDLYKEAPNGETREMIDRIKQESRALQYTLSHLPTLLDIGSDTMWGRHAQAVSIAQEVSLGNPTVSPPAQGHNVSLKAAMPGVMQWNGSLIVRGRPAGAQTRTAKANKMKHKKHPPQFADKQMSSAQRSNLLRAICHHTSYLQSCWRPPGLLLPPFNYSPLANSGDENSLPVVELFKQLWDWQDQCIAVMRAFRQATSTEYDYSPFGVAFGRLSRLTAVRGREFNACRKALIARLFPVQGSAPQVTGLGSQLAEVTDEEDE